jgi:SAM-dependent methyltransferase
MFSFSDSDISVDQLMHEIRESVAKRHREIPPAQQNLSLRSPDLKFISTNGESALKWQPEFQPQPNAEFHVDDFLKYHGATFVRNAYLGLLKRPADPSGAERYLAALASGKLNKLDVLARLHYSPEGKNAGVRLIGLGAPAFIRRLERLPYLGYVISVAVAVARLPNLHQQLRQSEFHLLAQQEAIANHFAHVHQQSLQEFQQAIGDVRLSLADQQQAIESLVERQQKQFEEHENNLKESLQALRDEAATALRTLTESDQMLENRLTAIENEAKSWSLDELYAAFEDEFRGPREEIKKRLEVYLPIVREAGIASDALDLGCGRGEWLEVLRNTGIAGYGVDHNTEFIARCRELDLNVIEADAIAHLQSLPAASLPLITGFHIVEHVSFKDLVQMTDEILRVLRPGGVLIFETPNPENFMVGSYSFYTDPTHRNPIPSATLKFLLEMRGFGRTEVMKLRVWKDAFIPGNSELVKRFNEYFYGAPDYAVVAWKV